MKNIQDTFHLIDEWKEMLFDAVDIIGNERKKYLENRG